MEFIEAKKLIISCGENNKWFGNNFNMNIYKGCCHGCIYCDSRSKCYNIKDFDRVRIKENALLLIEKELRGKRKTGVIGTGAMSDPYNPFEKEYKLTRGALELINRYGFGVAIATKSNLIERDIDILKKISKHSPVIVKITITTFDDNLSKKIEANAPLSSERFAAIKKLSDNNIYTGILLMPLLPFIEDNEENVKGIIREGHKNGAKFIYPGFGVTLRDNQRDWYFNKLDKEFPGIKEKYMKYYGNKYGCTVLNYKALMREFRRECDSLGIKYRMNDIINEYKKKYRNEQMTLFDE